MLHFFLQIQKHRNRTIPIHQWDFNEHAWRCAYVIVLCDKKKNKKTSELRHAAFHCNFNHKAQGTLRQSMLSTLAAGLHESVWTEFEILPCSCSSCFTSAAVDEILLLYKGRKKQNISNKKMRDVNHAFPFYISHT